MIDLEGVFGSLERLRRGLFKSIVFFTLTGIAVYPFSETLLRYLCYRPVPLKLVAFGVAEGFFALLELTAFAAIFISMPLVLYWGCRSLSPLLRLKGAGLSRSVPLFAIPLFYAGAAFCYFVTLPFGIQFLLGYQTAYVMPMISVQKYVSFCAVFIFGFGITFELPLVLSLLSEMRLISAALLTRNRKYAVLLTATVAAVATPTPDVFNMSLLGLPLYILFEIGVLLVRLEERKRFAAGVGKTGPDAPAIPE